MKAINYFLQEQKKLSIPTRVLGKTGRNVTILGFGSDGFLHEEKDSKKTVPLIEKAVESGINYFDTARSYGFSERHLGLVLPKYRDRIYLATKTRATDYQGAKKDLETSLKTLQTDYLDSLQLHFVNTSKDLQEIFSENGAIHLIKEAKKHGIIKYAGITGHNPWPIKEALQRYDFDTVLTIINAADKHILSNVETLLPICRQRDIGVIAMKIICGGRILNSMSLTDAFNYTMSNSGVHCSIIGMGSIKELEENVDAALNFGTLSDSKMKSLEDSVEDKKDLLNDYKR